MIWQIIAAIVAVFAGAVVTNKIVKQTTGKDIPTHIFAWWNSLRDRVLEWRKANPHLRSARILASIVLAVDSAHQNVKQMVDMILIAKEENREQEISTERVLLQDIQQIVTNAAPGKLLDLTDII